MKPVLNKINDICLYVDEFQATVKFYQEVFGFKLKRLQPGPALKESNYAEFDFDGTSITLWEKSSVQRDTVLVDYLGERNSFNFMIAIRVEEIDDVDEMFAFVTEKGAKSISRPKNYDFGSRAC